jgi:nitrogen fixation NifU-like protein
MKDIQDLYTATIVEHYRNPRHFHEIRNANRKAEGHNALCGDKFTVFMYLDGNHIAGIGISGSGCAVATASASMMAEKLKGKTEEEARKLFQGFMGLLSAHSDGEDNPDLGELNVFKGVRGYPARIQCASLPWQTMRAALEGSGQFDEEAG